ncbi:hypothetical protein AXF42_Ash017550 [Apostasia shenzhenica]|uniref:Uncharacterized protein n=1 Tax=Apostasia shenzhenica TaxID=1088818 RepID=A0A2I0A382_9ASPA|nr:hypothetical protein AXF42_Ash017550 [Apostasia shenzhenica]
MGAEMEVVVPPVHEFHFDSATTTAPYKSPGPSSPNLTGGSDILDLMYSHHASAPASSTSSASAAIYSSFLNADGNCGSRLSSVPFDWEEKPGTPKPNIAGDRRDDPDDFDFDFAFAFDFSGQLQDRALTPELTTADELFEQGKIRPLKPPPRLYLPELDQQSGSGGRPRSSKFKINRGRGRVGGKQDPFVAAMAEVTRERRSDWSHHCQASSPPPHPTPPIASTLCSGKGGGSGGRRWRLENLLFFRSALEGRATGDRRKDPLHRYTVLLPSSPSSSSLASPKMKKGMGGEDSRSSSFRSVDSGGTVRRRGASGSASSHEMHYAAHRAAAEKMKKKTALPYTMSFFSCFGNSAVHSRC